MGTFAVRQIVLLPFPFSDLSSSKLRPALVLADAGRGDWVLCQITSNPFADPDAQEIGVGEFSLGGLQRTSYARPGKLFTANASLFRGVAAELSIARHAAIVESVVRLLRAGAG